MKVGELLERLESLEKDNQMLKDELDKVLSGGETPADTEEHDPEDKGQSEKEIDDDILADLDNIIE